MLKYQGFLFYKTIRFLHKNTYKLSKTIKNKAVFTLFCTFDVNFSTFTTWKLYQ